MRNLFLFVLGSLIMFSHYIRFQGDPEASGGTTVYWATAVFPSRPIQLAAFKEWLSRTGQAPVNFQIDPANQGLQKLVVQGVAGVGAECVDVEIGQVPYLDEIGLTTDLSILSRTYGFNMGDFLPYVRDLLQSGNRILAAPFSPFHMMFLVNEDAFKRLDMPVPPSRWTLDQFEAIGKEYVARANAGKPRRDSWFYNTFQRDTVLRSLGLSYLNETLTAPTLVDPRMVRVLVLLKHWREDLHLAPTTAENQGLSSEGDVHLSQAEFLARGRFGLLWTGRYVFTAMRASGKPLPFNAVEPPHGGIPNTYATARVTVLNKAGKYPELAGAFMGFIASDAFSGVQADTADGMPPLTRWLTNERFLHPVSHTNEWKAHEAFARSTSIAMTRESSPYAFTFLWEKELTKIESGFQSGLYDAPEAARLMQEKVQEAFVDFLGRHPDRKPAYQKSVEKQARIEGMKARGEKVPVALIDNPVLRQLMLEAGTAR